MQQKISDELILINTMMLVAKERGEIVRLSSELNSVIEKAMALEKTSAGTLVDTIDNTSSALIKFTPKEIDKMPKSFRKTYKTQGCVAHIRKRCEGRYNCSYEIRYARKPFDKKPISASGRTIQEAKVKFIEKLNAFVPQDDTAPTIPKDFDGFAMYWFENFHRRKVAAKTYKNDLALYNRHIKPRFNNLLLLNIIPASVQEFLESLPGNGKTADDVRSILNQIFDTAVSHGILKLNPLNLFVYTPHERESGVELTQDEQIKLLSASKGTAYEIIFAVILFCGLRPNEYKTARIEGKFIVAVNSKRKNGKIEYKKIPICSALHSVINDCRELPTRHIANIRDNFNKLFPNHTLKDLRKTFSTRCVQLKVDYFARKKFVGQSVGKLDGTYIGNLDEYLLTEGKKLDEWFSKT